MKTLKEKIDEANNIINELNDEANNIINELNDEANNIINELNEVNKTIYSTLKDFKMSDNKAKIAIERMSGNNSAIKKQENIINKLKAPK